MRISELFTAIACVVPVLAGGHAFAQPRTTVVLGTATPGGGFPVYGAAFAATVDEADPTLNVEPRIHPGVMRYLREAGIAR